MSNFLLSYAMTSMHAHSPSPSDNNDPSAQTTSDRHDHTIQNDDLSRVAFHARAIDPDLDNRPLPSSQIPQHLREAQRDIEAVAAHYGLNFPSVHYEMVTSKVMNIVAARDGFPIRYPYWGFGMNHYELSTGYEYGQQKIYELVVNTDPVYAYLMVNNTDLDQKIVMAHVCGHADFFSNNVHFAHTDRNAMNTMANHGARIQAYMDRYGVTEVELFIDKCRAIHNLIDPFSIPSFYAVEDKAPHTDELTIPRFPVSSDYLDPYVNPPELLKQQQERAQREREKETSRFPATPERDVMQFLMENAPMTPWQRDVMSIIREEAYYFLPQMQTKIMNEGWASYWHSKLMTEDVAHDCDIIDYAAMNAGVLHQQPGQLNPYKLGVELFRHIEDKWDKGRFGKEYEECTDAEERANWDKKLGLGREKIFEVRKLHNDYSFLANFLDMDFCEKQKLFVFSENQRTGDIVIRSREFEKVKNKLLDELLNSGNPIIRVKDANYQNRGELLLHHEHVGKDLDPEYTKRTLEVLQKIWKRPVAVETTVKGDAKVLTYDGQRHSSKYV